MLKSLYEEIIRNIENDITNINNGVSDVAFYVKCRDNTICYFENNNLNTDRENCKNFDWFFLKLYDKSLNNYRYEKYLDLVNNDYTYCSLHLYTQNALTFFQQRKINFCNDDRIQKILWQDSESTLSLVYKTN